MGNANCCRRRADDDNMTAPQKGESQALLSQRGAGSRSRGRQNITLTQEHFNLSASTSQAGPPGAPVNKKWYHRGVSHEEAEHRLKSISGENGVYLVYDNPKSRGNYILLAIYNGDCVRWDINRKSDGTYILGEDGPRVKSHGTVRKLIKYHRGIFGKPIKMQQGGTLKLNDYVYEASDSGAQTYAS